MKILIGIACIAVVLLIAPLQAAVCDGVSPVVASNLVSVVAENGLSGKPLLVTAPPGDSNAVPGINHGVP